MFDDWPQNGYGAVQELWHQLRTTTREHLLQHDQVTCYGGSEHHGDGEQVPVREVGEVVMLERLT